MAEYPNIDAPVPDPRGTALRECILAMRAAMPLIATPPDRDVLKAVADRAEDVPGLSGPAGRDRRAGMTTPPEEVWRVLAELVELKDGPRDDAYRARKDAAWDRARAALALGNDEEAPPPRP